MQEGKGSLIPHQNAAACPTIGSATMLQSEGGVLNRIQSFMQIRNPICKHAQTCDHSWHSAWMDC